MKNFAFVSLIVLSTVAAVAVDLPPDLRLPDRQPNPGHHHMLAAAKQALVESAARQHNLAKDWVLDERPITIDVQHYALDLYFNPNRNLLTGHVTLRLAAAVDQLTEVILDADQALRILGVTQVADGGYPHDSSCTLAFDHRDHELVISLPRPLTQGEEVELLIAYGGNAGRDGLGVGWGRQGGGSPLITTFAQPYGARLWWPCNDRPDDKATVEVRVTVDDSLDVASNGLQQSRTANADGTATTVFASQYPVSTYLVVINITDYVYMTDDYESLDGSVTMPVEIWSYPHLASEAELFFDNTPDMIRAFADRFGEYPFLEEKYGNAHSPFGGGMEHQTLCSYGGNVMGLEWLNAHEVAHQWWGDTVTYENWKEIWLAEGLASYSEWLWLEETDPEQMIPYGIGSDNMAYFLGPLYDNDEQFSVTVYDKGAWVYHMLRWVVGDENFFAGLRKYRQDHAMGVAVTADLRSAMEELSGQDLEWFFEQWVYGENRPHYQYSWESVDASTVALTVRQVHSNAAPFRMPIEVELVTDAGSERHVVWIESEAEQTVNIAVSGGPVNDLVLDPDHWLLADIGPASDPDLELGPDYPGPIDFGWAVTAQTTSRTIPLSNVGESPLEVQDIIPWTNAGFTVDSPSEIPFTVAPGETVNLEITYHSNGYGTANEFLVFLTNDPSRGGVTIMPLVGVGVLSEEPQVILNPRLNFGHIPVGGLSERSFDIRNFGAQDLSVELGAAGGDFALASPSSFTLGGRELAHVLVHFSPSTVGEHESQLIMHTNDALHQEIVVPLAGEGVASAHLALDPPVLNFGVVTDQAALQIILANGGDDELVISQLAVNAPFNLPTDESLPFTLAPGEERSVVVRFEGSGEGEVRGTLHVHSNDPLLPVAVVPLFARPTNLTDGGSWAVAAAARTPGIGGAFWRSSVVFLNPGNEDLAVDVDFAPSGGSADHAVDLSLSVPAGAQRRIADALESADIEGAGGLRLRSVPGGLVALSRTFTEDATGSYGQYIPAVPLNQALSGTTETILAGLAGNNGFHSNFGMLNLGDNAVSVDFELFDAAGTSLGSLTLDAPAEGFAQISRGYSRFTTDPVRGGYAVVTSSDPDALYLAYGSVVDDASHDPTFVAPQGIIRSTLDLMIPAVASNPGLNNTLWRSELTLVNRGDAAATVALAFYPRGSGAVGTSSVEVGPSSALYLSDVVGNTLGREGSGWLHLSSDRGHLLAMSRTFNDSALGSFGQLVQGVQMNELFGPGEQIVLGGLRSDSGFRSNVGIASASDTNITVTLEAFAADGRPVGSVDIEVPANSLVQMERLLSDRFSYLGEAWVRLSSDDTGADYTAYLSLVDGGTGDPIFVPAVRSPMER